MNPLSLQSFSTYWTGLEMLANLTVLLNLLGALILGSLVGYERSYHGRAAGMRTYSLVCMASTALTVIVGYSASWYGGHAAIITNPDPTRVIQGIVTGIGFLGAGMIMHEGQATRGLATAASIWAASAIGVLIGIGFYLAAIMLALLAIFCMTLLTRLENWLPARQCVAVVLKFSKNFVPREEVLRKAALERGYEIITNSIAIEFQDGQPEWRFVALALGKRNEATITALSAELANFAGIESFHLCHARN
jgi:putative Mg2+ transporter-C (MgtC) family protein